MVMLMQQACLKNLKSDMDPGVIVSLMIGAERNCVMQIVVTIFVYG